MGIVGRSYLLITSGSERVKLYWNRSSREINVTKNAYYFLFPVD